MFSKGYIGEPKNVCYKHKKVIQFSNLLRLLNKKTTSFKVVSLWWRIDSPPNKKALFKNLKGHRFHLLLHFQQSVQILPNTILSKFLKY